MNVVDSSGWLEYFAGSDRADLFATAIEDSENLIVPIISIYEVFKKGVARAWRKRRKIDRQFNAAGTRD